MNTPKTLAKIGSVYIEEAILVVLEGEEGLRPEEISERLGIPTNTDGILRLANAVVLGFLTKLKLEGRVQYTIRKQTTNITFITRSTRKRFLYSLVGRL